MSLLNFTVSVHLYFFALRGRIHFTMAIGPLTKLKHDKHVHHGRRKYLQMIVYSELNRNRNVKYAALTLNIDE